jgi:hypothetical protein
MPKNAVAPESTPPAALFVAIVNFFTGESVSILTWAQYPASAARSA